MARKSFRLTKQALILIGIIILISLTLIVIKFGRSEEKKPNINTETETLSNVVVENQVLKVQLLDFVGSKEFDDKYQEVEMKVAADETLINYKISKEQTFKKAMKLLPPDENSPLLNHSSEIPTHEAYVLVLVGDIVEYTNDDGENMYRVVNGHIQKYKQSLLLEQDYDSVYIASIDGKKEKMVKISEYKAALSDPNEYMKMLQW